MSALHHDIITAPGAAPSRRLLLLHGIYGAGRNWGSVARRFVRARPAWSVVLVDLRSHGWSPRLAPHTVKACAEDLLRLEGTLEGTLEGPSQAVLGHSFGGKVALLYARMRTNGPRQLWIVDSAPGAGRPGGGAWRMLGVLRRHPGPFGTRAEAVAAVEAESPPHGTAIHFVKALGSSVLGEEDVARIRAAGRRTGRVFLHEVQGGHWVNTENPDAIHDLLVRSLR